ncbi:MAG: SHOCT domain-containing protein [Oscillospiraceae bacterium]|nr:SHOCT domain-containing protein [Oscillospiraceae bacterium]
MRFTASLGQTVFARYKDGYYYPAVVDEVLGEHINASFLDGDTGVIAKEDIMELQEGFETLHFQGNWQHGGIFYKGKLASHLPMVMHYNDGDVEQIELVQLRGKRPGPVKKPTKKNPAKKEPVHVQSEKEAIKELKALRKNGFISKEEFKRMKNQLR